MTKNQLQAIHEHLLANHLGLCALMAARPEDERARIHEYIQSVRADLEGEKVVDAVLAMLARAVGHQDDGRPRLRVVDGGLS